MGEDASDKIIKQILKALPSAGFRKVYKEALSASVDRVLSPKQLDELDAEFLQFKTDLRRLERCLAQLQLEVIGTEKFLEMRRRVPKYQHTDGGDELPDWLQEKPGHPRYDGPKFGK